MGQGLLQDVSGRLVQAFAQNVATLLEGGAHGPWSGRGGRHGRWR